MALEVEKERERENCLSGNNIASVPKLFLMIMKS